MPSKRPKPFAHFDFDLAAAMLSQLVATFDELPVVPLTTKMLSRIDPEQGIYMIYLSGKLMDIGKAVDSLPKRLSEYLKDLTIRKNVNVADLGFKCAIIPQNWMAYVDLKAFTAEYQWQWIGERKKSGSRTRRRHGANS